MDVGRLLPAQLGREAGGGVSVDADRGGAGPVLLQISVPPAGVPAVLRVPPVVPIPTPGNPARPEAAVFVLNWLSATGTGILVAALFAGGLMGFSIGKMLKVYLKTLMRVRY